MALRAAAPTLRLALALTAVATGTWAHSPLSALSPRQGCLALGRCCPGRDHTCAALGPPRCFCDQACGAARDCCEDYARACPGAPGARGAESAVSCTVSEWSDWSRCAKPCQVSYRTRRRHVLQEPRNGGAPCPLLEERAGCVEYWNRQGVECQQSLLPALITTDSYGKERRKRGVPKGQDTVGYCVRFQLGPIPGSCGQVRAPHAQWTRYLIQGHIVCVKCEWPAMDNRSQRCYGDGSETRRNQLLLWRAAGHPRCRGSWERLGQLPHCTCPAVHSFVFI
ncbi:PREDICTED: somatomedin-B and thrombospondin type-1 domain-containing protein-like [Elephantulus edwardii]|uniref:somatomedin-B and thrombospondin type-1 domain-containing protein-like n=1 Tax=Elephantulus edwardii TaxID=28737 RepID=UPI0003F09C78|nr:PREDICTED: somatomedin-B and thrombospondin type-1 domain-containing protein-like [Elephantulus edwardii]